MIPTPAYLCARLSYKFTGGPLPAPPRQAVRQSVEVKLLAEEGELYILVRGERRTLKERGIRRRRLL